MKEMTQELGEEETNRRRDAALLRALSTPHKRQKEMKIGRSPKGKNAAKTKETSPNASD
jgi:hypothetical protein